MQRIRGSELVVTSTVSHDGEAADNSEGKRTELWSEVGGGVYGAAEVRPGISLFHRFWRESATLAAHLYEYEQDGGIV